MGLRGLENWDKRQQFFRDAIGKFETSSRGDPHWLAIQFMKTMKVDRQAALHVLGSFAGAAPEWLAAFTMRTLVVCGSEDEDNGSAAELAAALPEAIFVEVPGTHMSSVTKPELGEEIARFLSA
jgi:pimeloyl-ACP methyl ester carboxylesterase